MAHGGRPGVPASQRHCLREPSLFVGDIVAVHRHAPSWVALAVIRQLLRTVHPFGPTATHSATRSGSISTGPEPVVQQGVTPHDRAA
ncbi:hypothetical protein ACRAWF_04235 [Streptomyces sp. L7]